jgi:beta-galactosidase
MKIYLFIMMLLLISGISQSNANTRKEISLNGQWKLTKTNTLSGIPTNYTAEVPVPGLVDMAVPAIDDLNLSIQNTNTSDRKKSFIYNNAVYWYKRTFIISDINSGIVQLKINKAQYHTKVYVNGKYVGENVYNFTPSTFDIKQFLKKDGQENELVISVGCRNNLPDTVINGGDFEKVYYIPGIYDEVKLVLSDYPFISNIQTVSNIDNGQLRVVGEIKTKGNKPINNVSYIIREAVSKEVVAKGSVKQNKPVQNGVTTIDFIASIPGFKLWSPENPFLYDLELSTGGDNAATRFGMRTFSASKDNGSVYLNGKVYYMRGTNVCIFRFFEDSERGDLPWNRQWVIKLHSRFKDMHFNSMRYCIGFPPEKWYEIADSTGFLIQDEFPIWTGRETIQGLTPVHIANEYRQWMRERWNHPCVVIWDAQNESVTNITSEAINAVRHLDLSARPWDNGWAAPASPGDIIESHPYLTSRYSRDLKKFPIKKGVLKDLLEEPQIPGNGPNQNMPSSDGKPYKNPIVINEFEWLWLNRNGSTTTLTDSIYAHIFSAADTPEKRFEVYAKSLGMITEYWRAHRLCAGVLYFCGLGYSRPDPPRGQTSDNFTDIKNLTFEPYFYRYVKPAFSPVGIMINIWDEKLKSGSEITVPVNLINDTYEKWSGEVNLSLIDGESIVSKQIITCELIPLGKKVIKGSLKLPDKKGKLKLVAEITYNGEQVKSVREFLAE